MDTELLAIQKRLAGLGFDPGPIDGVWGKDTRRALTLMMGLPVKAPGGVGEIAAPWFDIAKTQIGVKEGAGGHTIGDFFAGAVGKAEAETVPWCAAFVGWALDKTGYVGTGSLMARSYLSWGAKLDKPQRGAVVVFKRGAAPNGHVGFVDSWDVKTIRCLGGNQSNAVTVANFPRSSVLGFRWPSQAAA